MYLEGRAAEDLSRIAKSLESIAESQKVVAEAIRKEEERSNERMEIMRKIGQSVESGEAQILMDSGMVTKQ